MWPGLPEENEGVRGAAHWRQREKKNNGVQGRATVKGGVTL